MSTAAARDAGRGAAPPAEAPLAVSVVVPTYRRPDDLRRCLAALAAQTAAPREVLVVVRDGDAASAQALIAARHAHPRLRLRVVPVREPGQVAALNAGVDAASGEVVAITDDDAAPRPDWVARVVEHFAADPALGGLGGRDWMRIVGLLDRGVAHTVGRLQWVGRVVGRHHLGAGAPREVEVLKGANMSYRRAALAGVRFDARLRGSGAQVHNDLALSLAVGRVGWKLLYDPAVAVDHYPAPRHDEDQRHAFNPAAVRNMVHNETLVLLEHLRGVRRVAYALWAPLVGTREAPGLAQWLRFLPSQRGAAGRKLAASLAGRLDGWRSWRRATAVAPRGERRRAPLTPAPRARIDGPRAQHY